MDSLVEKVQACGYGCYSRHTCISIMLYADDVLLLAPSVSSLQLILSVCEKELHRLDMMINVKKVTLFAHWAAPQRQMQQYYCERF